MTRGLEPAKQAQRGLRCLSQALSSANLHCTQSRTAARPDPTSRPWRSRAYPYWVTRLGKVRTMIPCLPTWAMLKFQIWAKRSTYREGEGRKGQRAQGVEAGRSVSARGNAVGRRRSRIPSLSFNKGFFSPLSPGCEEKMVCEKNMQQCYLSSMCTYACKKM